jgi:hypothetical protein
MILKTKDLSKSGVGMLISILIWKMVFGAWLWTYAVNTGFALADSTIRIEWYHGLLMGLCPFVGGLSVPAGIITCVINAAVN